MKRFKLLPSLALAAILVLSCDKNNNVSLFFSPADDVALGQQVADEIAADPNYVLLSRSTYADAYRYLDSLTLSILNSSEVAYRDEFPWQVTIVQDDNTLNAFAAPGGYLYVYTGLIKYLNDADALAGVMGHEIAHADLRHTSRNLQRQYGVSLLLNILLGEDPSTLEQIAAQIAGTAAGLSFSREFETESDEKSVEYLSETGFACDGAKIFFEKLEASGQGGGVPEFLSTHPSPANRIQNITEKAQEENCDTTPSGNGGYAAFVADLP